nr:MAG TPA: hypothetical protein [Caudoviricetes sp.]DAK61686.1 MAG TPA: hypothetical protein [Bacteriophage sp.]DAQ41408.1 MAG TPA: hypothetical protein [Caudoviricetes sp.]
MTTNQIHITIKYKKYERAVSSEAALLLCKGVKGNSTESRKDF